MRIAILHLLICLQIELSIGEKEDNEETKKPVKYTEKEVKEMIKRRAKQLKLGSKYVTDPSQDFEIKLVPLRVGSRHFRIRIIS